MCIVNEQIGYQTRMASGNPGWLGILAAASISILLAAPPLICQGPRIRDSAGIEIVENRPPLQGSLHPVLVDSTSILVPGIRSPWISTGVNAVLTLANGTLVVAYRQSIDPTSVANEVTIFNSSGALQRRIGHAEGIGHFQEVSALFRAAGDSVVAWDGIENQLTWIPAAGASVRSVQVARPPTVTVDGHSGVPRRKMIAGFSDGALLAQYHWVRMNPATGAYSDSMTMSLVTPSGFIRDFGHFFVGETLVLHVDSDIEIDRRPFGRVGTAAAAHASWYYSDGSAFEIREFDEQGRLIRIIRLEAPLRTTSPIDIAQYQTTALAGETGLIKRNHSLLLDLIPSPERFPAYVELVFDDSGYLWARRFEDNIDGPTWDLFNGAGEYVGPAVTPRGCKPVQIGHDRLLAICTDNVASESVRIFRLSRGPSAPF